ncbi:D-alanine--D-alanine ligase [Wolbachia endosymbiont of Drosophila simulans wNo]|uniref:D-alanine--D-alanine ligase n=1 Tax=unclassified Wolbachia TaxID=2640676 RepID=UPI0002D24DBA|nr:MULTISPECIES: D-alanine--D-alanine ligase [unclassified Wolbachia]AGJ99413.1 D-alanine--D-alanine ligase [Wolbachia endosymbiont of Drosophila simulans wNo]QCB62602.1 D-alanine--D-alanine ligase [Wolbachia endosymbiont of Drosophila mauritiana]QCB63648.1 D-alanine--D-alanine ligase [Wolbachia endosymbiont of Drosophila mauritiana]QWE33072.1 D-alanine--D-alanine ligase [Wolbachia endosymbiont of Drosophila simulans]TGB07800.1 D-alanine--D-alanine ligase [Wolbachia endosymbiont of Drosophila 
MLMIPTIAILSGGFSCEREISLMSGKAVKKALDSLLYKAIEIDVDSNIAQKLKKTNPALAFIALHGPYGEDGCIQGLLEILGIKYTHSGVTASAVAMNKVMSKHIFRSLSIDTPKGYVISREDLLKNNIKIDYPYVLKPINEGSSIGVHMIFSHEDYLELKNNSSTIMEKMIIEEYIPGIELHTAVLLNEAIGTMEIRPKNKFYDYEAKYTDGFAEHIFPAEIPNNIYRITLEHALKVHQFLGCKTVSRSDFRYNPQNNTLKMLEVNTHPGFTELSLVPEIAKLTRGIDFNELVKIIVEDSLHHRNIRDQADVEQCY